MKKTTKDRLYNILLEQDRLKRPNVPDHCRMIMIHPDVNEKGIKANIKQFCSAMKLKLSITESKAVRTAKIENLQHASGRTIQKVSTFYRKSEFERGHHDIEISKNNRLFCIEIKAQNKKTKYKDKQSDEQKTFEKKLNEDFGNDYYIIRGMDDFFDLFDNVITPLTNGL